MSGEKNLRTLLGSLNPVLNKGDFVFCTLKGPFSLRLEDILFLFRENPETTVVMERGIADEHKLPYSSTYGWITLEVHSALDAVGLTASVSAALASQNISCNVVAAFHHDHLFIPKKDADQALKILQELSLEHQS